MRRMVPEFTRTPRRMEVADGRGERGCSPEPERNGSTRRPDRITWVPAFAGMTGASRV